MQKVAENFSYAEKKWRKNLKRVINLIRINLEEQVKYNTSSLLFSNPLLKSNGFEGLPFAVKIIALFALMIYSLSKQCSLKQQRYFR